jgi:hypothetical protein
MTSNFARNVLVSMVALAIVACAAHVAPAEKPATAGNSSPASDAEIQRWIADLGNDAYPVRQQAADRLLAAGSSARLPLIKLADGPDPETRAAARRLISLIDRSEFHRRLEAFAADADGRQGLTMPGWDAYRKLVGGDADDRALFVEMQKNESALMAAVFDNGKRSRDDLLEARLQRVTQWQPNVVNATASPSLGSCAAMVFLGSIAETEPSDAVTGAISILVQRPPLREHLQRNNGQNAVRRLATAWILNCPNKNESSINSRLMAMGMLGLEDALPLPLAIIAGGPDYAQLSPAIKALAAVTIGQLGNRSHVARLEPLLNDATIYMTATQEGLPGAPAGTVQVRDVALVVLLRLTDQAPADYGYIAGQQFSPRQFSIQPFGADGDKRRAQAIAKWRQWRTEHPDDKAGAAEKAGEKAEGAAKKLK